MFEVDDFIWNIETKGQYCHSLIKDLTYKTLLTLCDSITSINAETHDTLTKNLENVNTHLHNPNYHLNFTFSIKGMSLKEVSKDTLLEHLGNGELHWINIAVTPRHNLKTFREHTNERYTNRY